MPKLEGSKTEKNLRTALEGEALAHMKYEYYASQAKKDGYVQIQDIFLESSKNEKEHGKVWFKLLNGGSVSDTLTNLKESVKTEEYEWSDMYKNFAIEARVEGFDEIADLFDLTAQIEREHERRYKTLIHNIENDKVFERDEKIIWKCQNCGLLHVGKGAPEKCLMCNHPKAHYRQKEENY